MTDKGRMYSKNIVVHITQSEDLAMSMFTEEEQNMLIDLSRKFTKNLEALIKGEITYDN